ncbi:MAG: 5' nucleotidase, NT5C type [Patescibacteria group bacterium]
MRRKRKEVPQTLRIGVDIDANVDNLYLWFCRLARRRFKINLGFEDLSIFWLDRIPKMKTFPNAPVFVEEVFAREFVYQNAKPIPGAIKTLNKWRNQGHEIWLVTARPQEALAPVTYDWLRKNGSPWATERVIFRDSWGKNRARFKADVAKKLDLHVFIEDHAETVKMIKSPSLIVNVVLEYPWNINEDIGNKSIFAKNWKQIDEIVQAISCGQSIPRHK